MQRQQLLQNQQRDIYFEEQASFERYKIPPDFDMVDLHFAAALPYAQDSDRLQQCQCCHRYRRLERIPFCQSSSELTNLGEQIPLYFYYLKATSIFLIWIIIAQIGNYQFCQLFEESSCNIVYAKVQLPSVGSIEIPTGYEQRNTIIKFVQFCIFALSIVVLKIFLKMRKYQVKSQTESFIANRTLKIVNVHQESTVEEIKEFFQPYIVEVVFTYKVKDLEECLNKINKLIKVRKILKEQYKNSTQSKKQDQTVYKKSLEDINDELSEENKTLKRIKREFGEQKNRLDICFIIFTSIAQKQQAYRQFHTSFCTKLLRKCCFCCSKTAIRGQSFSVKVADAPTDISWANLEKSYFWTKVRRGVSLVICGILLIFGLGSEYLFTDFTKNETIVGPLIRTGTTLVLNFIIMVFLEYTTQNIEDYESHTKRHVTLVKKLTIFLFINISLSPILGYYLNTRGEDTEKLTELLSELSFSVLLIAVGNILKPIPTWLSIDRLFRAYSKYSERKKAEGCESVMTQIEANKAFEPVEFPISTYYALSLSSLLTVCFYIDLFQVLILVELGALVVVYWVSKWMLLRVAKSPEGLARRINNVAQSVIRFMILVEWLGSVLIEFLMLPEGATLQESPTISADDESGRGLLEFVEYITRDAFSIVEIVVVFVMTFFLEYFVAWVSKFILGKQSEREPQFCQQQNYGGQTNMLHDPLLDPSDGDSSDTSIKEWNSYRNANLHCQMEEEMKKFESSVIK